MAASPVTASAASAAAAGSSQPAASRIYQSKGGASAKKNRKYGTPLPILLPTSPLHPNFNPNAWRQPKSAFQTYIQSITSLVMPSVAIVPQCRGVYDSDTRSVWVKDRKDMDILFNRGFFGKGSLSRSEPTWRARRIASVKEDESAMLAEGFREKRRQERKKFKQERANAMLEAVKAAEAVITSTAKGSPFPASSPLPESGDLEDDEDQDDAASIAPTNADIDINTLTSSTFLVRPTRPDANRNRGRNNRRGRKPPQPMGTGDRATTVTGSSSIPSTEGPVAPAAPPRAPRQVIEEKAEESEDSADELVEEMEHLQLSLEEAWFLSEALGVLRVYDPQSDTLVPHDALLPLLITPPSIPNSLSQPQLRPDDPFLVSYACYHHFRSLGFAIKNGIKFGVDWLLYFGGVVFNHSESVVMIPVYMDENDRVGSPYADEDWYQERMSWKWMNTIMRVNTIALKTTIWIAYITIPSLSSFPDHLKLPDGSLDPYRNTMESLLTHYSVREVSLQRFGPAKRRD